MSANLTIQDFHSFTDHPAKFWPAFLAFASSQTNAQFCILLTKKSSAWKTLFQWSKNRRQRKLSEPLITLLSDFAEKCLHNSHGATHAKISSRLIAVGQRFVEKEESQVKVGVFLFKAQKLANVEEIHRKLAPMANTPAVYQGERAIQQAQKNLVCFSDVLDMLLLLNAENRFLAAAMTLVNETAARYHCSRVSLGWRDNGYVRLQSISHMERFERKMDIVSGLEAAMEESLDQDEEILWPCSNSNGTVTRDHEIYSKNQQAEQLISLPLRNHDQPVGVLTCEREDTTFSEDDVRSLRILSDQISCRLGELKLHDRWFGARLKDYMFEKVSRLFGWEHTLAKLCSVLACVLFIASILVKLPYRVEAPFILRSKDVRQVSAPFDGYIDNVLVKVGQHVDQGDPLLLLDSSDLMLEESAALANQIRFQREGEKARALNTLIEMKIAQARADQAQAQLELIRHHLSQAQVSSPITGIIVEGDLDELQGAPVSKGDILFKVARHENLFVELNIKEEDVHELSEGQLGKIAFVSRPEWKFPFTINQIDLVALQEDAGNVFIARGTTQTPSVGWWRPGMSGIAKIDINRRSILWIFTHRTMEYLQMLMWW